MSVSPAIGRCTRKRPVGKGKKLDPAWLCCWITAANCMIITAMYTLAPFMVLEFSHVDRQAIGYWSGYVVAAFFLARAVTLQGWGWLSDRCGHSIVIRASLCLTGIGTLLLGFATSLETVILARLFTGACSAVHANCCAVAYEISGNKGSAIVESGFSAAKLVGPGLAGFLLQAPLPACLSGFPFLMPCAVLALAQFLAMLLVPPDAPKSVAPERLLCSEPSLEKADAALEHRRSAMHAQVLSAGSVMVIVAMDECFVLYGVGQLRISAPELSAVFAVAGTADLILQNTLLLEMVKGANTSELVRLRRNALVWLALPLASLPFAAISSEGGGLRVLLLGLFSGVRTAVCYVFFVANCTLLNIASPGRVTMAHSVRMAVSSVLQVAGPILGSSAYAWSTSGSRPFPFDQHLTFMCAGIWSIFLAWLA